MFRRTYATALQRTSCRLNAVSKAAPLAEKAGSPASGKPVQAATNAAKSADAAPGAIPTMTTKAGASVGGGDTVMDKAILAASLAAVAIWWFTVPGPHNQH